MGILDHMDSIEASTIGRRRPPSLDDENYPSQSVSAGECRITRERLAAAGFRPVEGNDHLMEIDEELRQVD